MRIAFDRTFITSIHTAVLVCMAPAIAPACSCSFGETCWIDSGKAFAFVGRALKTYSISDRTLAFDFEVSEAFGELSGKRNLTVYTNAGPFACGYPFHLGVEYYVSANLWESHLYTSICGDTGPANASPGNIRHARERQAGKPPASLFGFVAVNPYPGVPPLRSSEIKPVPSVVVTAMSRAGEFKTKTAVDGTFEFTRLPPAKYRLRLDLPKGLFIWWASDSLSRQYAVRPKKTCRADFALYPENDPYAVDQKR